MAGLKLLGVDVGLGLIALDTVERTIAGAVEAHVRSRNILCFLASSSTGDALGMHGTCGSLLSLGQFAVALVGFGEGLRERGPGLVSEPGSELVGGDAGHDELRGLMMGRAYHK